MCILYEHFCIRKCVKYNLIYQKVTLDALQQITFEILSSIFIITQFLFPKPMEAFHVSFQFEIHCHLENHGTLV